MYKLNKGSKLLLVGLFGLAGCNEQPEPSSKVEVASGQASAPITTPAPAAKAVVQVPVVAPVPVALPVPYEATLEEGIDFKKPGYPTFLSEVSGVSGVEGWGRWSDANAGSIVKFRFKKALPKTFTLEIVANAFGPNEGLPIKVRVGDVVKTFTIVNKKEPATYSLQFKTDGKAGILEITPPKPISAHELDEKNAGTRKLGIGFVVLKIIS